jgi:CRISPR-associated endoribonuclease Cas6
MHAILFTALGHDDRALADRLHDAPVNPFTQALLGGRGPDDPLRWRITLLDDSLYEPVLGGLHATQPTSVQGKPMTLDLTAVRSQHQTYDGLRATPVAYRHEFRFHTPTTFKKQYYHAPIPEPHLCWQSWWTRWQACAPARLAINVAVLDIAAAHLVVSRFRLDSRVVRNEQWHFIGAVGQMTFSTLAAHKVDTSWWHDVTALAAFSTFCGSGHKTAFGLGQTQWRAADNQPYPEGTSPSAD